MNCISIATLLVVVVMASASDDKRPHYDLNNANALFEQFIKDFEKVYKDDADRETHFQAFVKSLETINKLNTENSSATYGLNKFSDYTEGERKNMFGLRRPEK